MNSIKPEYTEFSLKCDLDIIRLLVEKKLIVRPILHPRLQLQPTSIDLRLGTSFAVIKNAEFLHLDLLKDPIEARREAAKYLEKYTIGVFKSFVLHPSEFALGATYEYIRMPNFLAGRLEGKSTWGRLGLQIHSTAGFVDPEFEGSLTFELNNVGKAPIQLYPGMRIAQICFFQCNDVMEGYGKGKKESYSKNVGLKTSLYFNMPEFEILRKIRERSKGGTNGR